MGRVMPFVSSLMLTFVYVRLFSVAVCPDGQTKVVAGGISVSVPLTEPFLTENVPSDDTCASVVVFFGSLGTFPPLFASRRGASRVVDHLVVPEAGFLKGDYEIVSVTRGVRAEEMRARGNRCGGERDSRDKHRRDDYQP
jgi:hypothetical protein